MNSTFFGATDLGKMRQNNEDAFFVQPVLNGAFLAACVIDGVGGYEGGEIAAQITQRVLPDYLRIASGDVATMMVEAMLAANEKIIAEKRANPALSDMACVATLVLADEAQNRFHYIHVGDTRLYLYRDGTLIKVSKDQSFVGFLEDNGRLSEAEAMNHPKRNEINKALGFEPQIKRDYFEIGDSPFLPGDLLLLCSDGLTDLVPSATITEVLGTDISLDKKTAQLIDAANAAGGKDNISVVLVQHSRKPQKQRATKPKQPKKAAAAQAQKTATPSINMEKEQKQAGPKPPPATPVVSGRKAIWGLSILSSLLAAALILLLYQQYGPYFGFKPKAKSADKPPIFEILQQAGDDTLALPGSMVNEMLLLSEAIGLKEDTVRIMGNGLHLKAEEGYQGAGFRLHDGNQYLLLENMVLEDFSVAIMAKNQTVRLKNVRFVNCVVPVQYGDSMPVNSPIDLNVSDTIFYFNDTLSR